MADPVAGHLGIAAAAPDCKPRCRGPALPGNDLPVGAACPHRRRAACGGAKSLCADAGFAGRTGHLSLPGSKKAALWDS